MYIVIFVTSFYKKLNKIFGKFYVRLITQAQFIQNILWNIICMHCSKQEVVRRDIKMFANSYKNIQAWLLPSIFYR